MPLAPSPARDRLLEHVVRDLLDHDDRLRGCSKVSARVDGGVVHLTGEVPTRADWECLHTLLGRLREVHAVWDRVGVAGERPLRVVDLGAGGAKQYADSVGLDRVALPGVDVVADLAAGVPLRDGAVDRVVAVHVLEHVVDLLRLLNELHRVLAPYGVLHAMVPEARSVNAVADPTHVRFFSQQTFKYVCRAALGVAPWRPLHVGTDGPNVFADLTPCTGAPPDAATLAWWFD